MGNSAKEPSRRLRPSRMGGSRAPASWHALLVVGVFVFLCAGKLASGQSASSVFVPSKFTSNTCAYRCELNTNSKLIVNSISHICCHVSCCVESRRRSLIIVCSPIFGPRSRWNAPFSLFIWNELGPDNTALDRAELNRDMLRFCADFDINNPAADFPGEGLNCRLIFIGSSTLPSVAVEVSREPA